MTIKITVHAQKWYVFYPHPHVTDILSYHCLPLAFHMASEQGEVVIHCCECFPSHFAFLQLSRQPITDIIYEVFIATWRYSPASSASCKSNVRFYLYLLILSEWRFPALYFSLSPISFFSPNFFPSLSLSLSLSLSQYLPLSFLRFASPFSCNDFTALCPLW